MREVASPNSSETGKSQNIRQFTMLEFTSYVELTRSGVLCSLYVSWGKFSPFYLEKFLHVSDREFLLNLLNELMFLT